MVRDDRFCVVIDNIVPKLAESEDENIIKEIISIVKSYRESCITEGNHRFDNCLAWLEKRGEQKHAKTVKDVWKDMRLEAYAQATGNRHEPNYSDDSTKLFSLNDIDEIFEKISEKQGENKSVEIPALVCPKCMKSFDTCNDHPSYHNRINYICPHCGYDGDSTDFETSYKSHPIHSVTPLMIQWNGYNVPSKAKYQQTTTDKIEPKFKVGDWVVYDVYNRDEYSRLIIQVYDIRDGRYYFNNNVLFSWTIKDCDERFHLWTIQDAEDGDVLYMNNGLSTCTFIYKSINNTIIQKYASYNEFGFEGRHYLVLNDGYVCPATKEQCNLLFAKMKEAGYEWDADNKELKKIEQKPQNRWKPSDEQMKYLEEWVKDYDDLGLSSQTYLALKSLYNELKKL